MVRNIREIWECALRELRRRQTRSLVNMSGYIIAIGVLLTMLTFLDFSKKASDSVLGGVGTHFIVYRAAVEMEGCCLPEDEFGEGFFAAGVPSQPLPYSVVEEISSLEGVADASPYISYRAYDAGGEAFFLMGGFDPASPVSVGATVCRSRDVVKGKFLEESDRGVVLLHENYAVVNRLTSGDKIVIMGREFAVKGIVSPVVRPARADIYMHIEDAAGLLKTRVPTGFSFGGWPNNVVLVEVSGSTVQGKTISRIRDMEGGLDIYTFGCYIPAGKAMGVNQQTLWFLTLLILAAAVLFSMKTQFASVAERRRDIGILKAVGWPDKAITWQILLESLVQAVGGGLLGCMAAMAAVHFVPLSAVIGPEWEGMEMHVPRAFFFLAIVLSTMGGILAGIIPALHMARKHPAESIRHI